MKEHTTAIGSKHTEYSDKDSAVGDRIVLAIEQSYKVSETLLSLIYSMRSSSYTELLKSFIYPACLLQCAFSSMNTFN